MNLLGLTAAELGREFGRRYGKGRYHAHAVYRHVFGCGNLDLDGKAEFVHSAALVRRLSRDFSIDAGQVVTRKTQDGLIKFVTRLHDGLAVESVLIPMATHNTLCISTQVGCRMGCRFCETARMGWQRDLTAAEIVAQAFTARVIMGLAVRNVVFMGMGEPLDNLEAVLQAIRVMNDPRGLNVALRHITVSTVGQVDAIERLAARGTPGFHLAISLNAPNDRIRSALMPVNRQAGMDRLRQVLQAYPLKPSGAFFVEYILIKGINDARSHARQLARYLEPLPAKVNVIAYNRGRQAAFAAPSEAEVRCFCDWLVAEKVFVRRRATRGQAIWAGCGQLGTGVGSPRIPVRPPAGL